MIRGTFEACFLCNTGRLKLKGAKLKNECSFTYERYRLSNCGIEDRKWKKRQTANLRLKGSEKESFKKEQRGQMKAN